MNSLKLQDTKSTYRNQVNENSYRSWKVEKVTALKIFTWDSKGNWNQIIVCENTLKRHSTEI